MKHLCALLLAALLSAGLTVSALAAEAPETSAAAYVLMDDASGRVLASKDPEEPRLIASTTKVLTALLALEALDLDEEVVIDPAWTGIEGSTMYLAPGQTLTVRELLYGLLLASGNDAATALACLVSGSVEAFAERMNERAAALGCGTAHFENPSGLDGEAHHASALDLAKILREAIRNDEFVRLVSTQSVTVGDHTFVNHNRLLRECEGVFGGKTGYTEAAGRTLVSCCERGGVTILCVTLSDPDDWQDHAALYDWAYGEYSLAETAARSSFGEIPVIGGEKPAVGVVSTEALSVLRREGESVSIALCLPRFVYADVRQGDRIGTASVFVDGVLADEAPLVFSDSVSRTPEIRPGFRSVLNGILSFERNVYILS